MHEPTPESRERVRLLSSFGVSREDLAKYLKIGVNTLLRHYEDELHDGVIEANAKVAERLYGKAIGGDTIAMIFWLKTRAKWRDVDKYVEKPLQESVLEVLQQLVQQRGGITQNIQNQAVTLQNVGTTTSVSPLPMPPVQTIRLPENPIQETVSDLDNDFTNPNINVGKKHYMTLEDKVEAAIDIEDWQNLEVPACAKRTCADEKDPV